MKRIILFVVLCIISTFAKSEKIAVKNVITSDIQYTYSPFTNNPNDGAEFTYTGDGLNDIMKGYVYYVISSSTNFDDSEYSYVIPFGRFYVASGTTKFSETYNWYNCKKFLGITNNSVILGDNTSAVNGIYYQCMILYYYSKSEKKWKITAFKEKNNKDVIVGSVSPNPEPEPGSKYDLTIESIKVTPTSNYLDGDVKASVTIKNNGNKTANNCCVRFFLSKNNTVNKPYQYLFSTVFKLGSLNAGASITHEETLYFLSQSAASPGSYYIIADVYSSSAEKEDADNTNNQKATPFTVKSSKSLNIINERSFIRINNITEEDLGNTIYITGSNARSIKQIPINTTGEMMITNQWSDPILFITIVNKDGTKEDLKMNNTK